MNKCVVLMPTSQYRIKNLYKHIENFELANPKLFKDAVIHVSSEYYFAIPQIDWSNIHINQKELWDKGDYDNAVLAEMHLKWNKDKTKIIQA